MILKIALPYLITVMIFSFFINLLGLAVPLYMLSLFMKVLQSSNISSFYDLTAIAVMAVLTMKALDLIRSRLLVQLAQKLTHGVGEKLVRATLHMMNRPGNRGYGEAFSDLETLTRFLSGTGVVALFDIPWIFIYIGVLYLMHPVLAVTAALGGSLILLIGFLQKRFEEQALHRQNQIQREDRHLIQTLTASSETIVAMGMGPDITAHRNRIDNKTARSRIHADNRIQWFASINRAFMLLVKIAMFYVGARLVLSQNLGMGIVFAASILMGQALSPVNQAFMALQMISETSVAYGRLSQALTHADVAGTVRIDSLEGHVRLHDVHLDIKGREVLSEINFTIKPGERVVFLGHNGAGKSSLIRLILGQWHPTRGEVVLDGTPTTDIDFSALGHVIGYLPQNLQLFSGRVGENIARLEAADPESVIQAAKKAGAHEMILGLPMGYDTDMGENGHALSGGQKQRIALARAMYGSPALVVLDEPDANLDRIGDAALSECLNRLKAQRVTTILVTHKHSFLTHADRILELKKGRIHFWGEASAYSG